MAAVKPLEVSQASFEAEVLKSTIPVAVDFWADWCGPCKMIAPILEEVAQEYSGKAKICKLNVDENQSLAARYGIRSIPCLLIFKDGGVVSQVVGAVPKGEITKRLEEILGT